MPVWLAVPFLHAPPALAQTWFCDRPSEPHIPSGYFADDDQMIRAERAVTRYLDQMREYLECLDRETKAAADEADSVIHRWKQSVRAFNNQR